MVLGKTRASSTNWAAIVALAFGIIAALLGLAGVIPYVGNLLAVTAFVPASLATALGQVALARADATGRGRRIAMAGFVLGCTGVALIFATFAFWALGTLLYHPSA